MRFFLGTQNGFETAVVNKQPLKFYCSLDRGNESYERTHTVSALPQQGVVKCFTEGEESHRHLKMISLIYCMVSEINISTKFR